MAQLLSNSYDHRAADSLDARELNFEVSNSETQSLLPEWFTDDVDLVRLSPSSCQRHEDTSQWLLAASFDEVGEIVHDSISYDSPETATCRKYAVSEEEAKLRSLIRRKEQNRSSQRRFRQRQKAKIDEATSQIFALREQLEGQKEHVKQLHKLNIELNARVADFRRLLGNLGCHDTLGQMSVPLLGSIPHISTLPEVQDNSPA